MAITMAAYGTIALLALVGSLAPVPPGQDRATSELPIVVTAANKVPLPRPRPSVRERKFDGDADSVSPAPLPLPKPAPGPRTAGASLPRLPPDKLAACMSRLEDAGITAEMLPPIREEPCGMHRPLQVGQIGEHESAVDLIPDAKVRCPVAHALAQWMELAVQPAAEQYLGGHVTGLRIASSYVCRARNSVFGAQLSEHALGNAIDISGFEIAGEEWIAVGPREKQDAPDALFLSEVREAACSHFHTVLGPGSDAHHADHFHFDLAHRGASGTSRYCK